MKQEAIKNPAAVTLGELGGRAGRGDSKRRSAAHYKRLSLLGVRARLKKLQNKS